MNEVTGALLNWWAVANAEDVNLFILPGYKTQPHSLLFVLSLVYKSQSPVMIACLFALTFSGDA